MVMLVEGGEFNHSSSRGMAADNVNERVLSWSRRALVIVWQRVDQDPLTR